MGTPPLPISVLDFSPMRDGEPASDSLRRTVELAKQVEELGYRRTVWNVGGAASRPD